MLIHYSEVIERSRIKGNNSGVNCSVWRYFQSRLFSTDTNPPPELTICLPTAGGAGRQHWYPLVGSRLVPAGVLQLVPLYPGISSAGKPWAESSVLPWMGLGVAPALTANGKTQRSSGNVLPRKTPFGYEQLPCPR